ncbi:MAG: hypothetical protein JOY92_12625 [Verrucomicrobia bacterium]|nr:hypothetical protein [Verrucomicrobiota bacterium]
MACCGQRRQQAGRPIPVRQANNPGPARSVSRPVAPSRTGAFQYFGKTALTVIGPVSRRHYRFSHPGAVVEIDLRDVPSLAVVPNLRQVQTG